jgi:hypothetical protein
LLKSLLLELHYHKVPFLQLSEPLQKHLHVRLDLVVRFRFHF